jgi:hypothetical protein
MQQLGFPPEWAWLMIAAGPLAVWEAVWKAIALWRAGGNRHSAWFICIFIFNTLGILPIIYIFGFSKKKPA